MMNMTSWDIMTTVTIGDMLIGLVIFAIIITIIMIVIGTISKLVDYKNTVKGALKAGVSVEYYLQNEFWYDSKYHKYGQVDDVYVKEDWEKWNKTFGKTGFTNDEIKAMIKIYNNLKQAV